ncbi:serine carboxypeptidase-like 31 [Phtheirospermum japonicum]|uniref:Carboxypeptidase n=1 Tax=Phtheirospermum japonicum TaxID=374723 RepID=A0A830CJ33_9LAMI|nr:serine carboxypeptidase-like 31 [Phtheirospermum japonicum]
MDIVLKLVFVLSLYMIFIEIPLLVDARNWRRLIQESNNNLDHLVTNLPGQPSVNFQHYAGHITVNEQNGRALFYWFYEATTRPDEKPLVLWLNGGPGCSSVGYGATQEIGPFLVDTNGQANLLFLESPIGVGFSYTNTSGDYDSLGDDFTANDAYAFLHKWFLKFPLYRKRTFYIAGESYAGKYVPELAEIIVEKNKQLSLFINLRGILLGNPETHDAEDWKGMVDYAWSHAVVSDETHKTIIESCDFYSDDTWYNRNCSAAVDELFSQYKEIDIYSLYTPVCVQDSSGSQSKATLVTAGGSSKMMPRVMGGYDPCLDDYAKSYYNRADVQKALHVITDGISLRNWSICNMSVFHGWSESKGSVLPIYKKLIKSQLRIWVYSGDTDGRVPVLSTRYSLSSLGLRIKMPWRPWYHNKQVAGWRHEYYGLTFATFRGAGHAVPIFKPSESLALFASFLAGESLPSQR